MSLNRAFMKSNISRISGATVAVALAGALLTGCAGTPSADAKQDSTSASPAASVQVNDAWIKAAPHGMTSGFASLKNSGDKDMALTAVASTVSGTTELHEMVGSGTSMSMSKLEGPLVIPAHSTVELEPGGKHIMLMDLTKDLQAGTSATLVLTFADASTQNIEFQVKEFSGAKESYAPESGHDGHTEHGDH